MTKPNYDYLYQSGGSLGSKAPSYVTRDADNALFKALKAGNFCYIFNSRQMGKSSLRVRVGNRLKQAGYLCAALDLSKVGGDEHLSPDKWYRSLIADLNRALSLLSDAEFDTWLAVQDGFTASYTLTQFIEEVVLAKTQGQSVVIFIDEIDSVLSLAFDTNDLFAVIRACYNQRADNPDYERLNFALFGVATPAKLMRDTSRTPFNIGKAIRLTPLALAQASPLEAGLIGWVEEPTQVLYEIFEWTGGQPYLTQKLCELVQEYAIENGAVLAIDSAKKVTELVEQHILRNWQLQDEQNHLKTIQDRMLRQGHLANRVLDLYSQVLKQGEPVVDSTDEAAIELRLSGAVIQTERTLRPFNQISQRVFNADWVAETISTLRPYAATFDAWVASGCKDESALLRGKTLSLAEAWAEGKSLSDLDNRYLRESQASENKAFQKRAKVVAVISVGVAIIAACLTANSLRRLANIEEKIVAAEDVQLLAFVNAAKALFAADKSIEATIAAVKAGETLKRLRSSGSNAPDLRTAPVVAVLQQVTYIRRSAAIPNSPYPVREQNRLLVDPQTWVHSVSFSPNSKTIVASGPGGSIRLWDLEKGIALRDPPGYRRTNEKIATNFNPKVVTAFSPDGKTVAYGGPHSGVKLWDIEGTEVTSFRSSSYVHSISFSPDGKTIASGGFRGRVTLRNIEGTELASFSNGGPVESLSFSPDGSVIASTDGNDVKLWSIENNEFIRFSGHQSRIISLSFSPDGKLLASGSANGTIKLWTQDGTELATLSTIDRGTVHSLSFSPDGKLLASGHMDGTVRLWTTDGTELATLSDHKQNVFSVRFSPDNKTLASAGRNGIVRLWDLEHTETRRIPKAGSRVSISFARQLLAFVSDENIISLWNLEKDSELATLVGHQGPVNSVVFSPTDEVLASSSDDGTVKLWESDGTELATLLGHQGPVNSVRFSPDGKTIASSSDDGTVKLWESDGTELATLLGHQGPISDVRFSPDSKTVAAAGRAVRLLDLHGNELAVFSGEASRISFSPDGKTIAAAVGRTIRLLDLDGNSLATLFTPLQRGLGNQGVTSLEFSPDGTLAAAAADGTVRLWNVEGTELATLPNFGSVISFSPDGKILASNGRGIELWDRDLDSLLGRSCDWLAGYLHLNFEGQKSAEEGVCEDYL